jgi:putative SOS response-associated peptidase YedK
VPAAAADAAERLGLGAAWDRAPGGLSLVVLRDPASGARVPGEMRWGLRPGGRGRAARLTHLRAEALVSGRPSPFRDAVRARRFCLVPMDGYVQRASRGGAAGRCFAVSLAEDGAPMAVAALWDAPDEGAAAYAIITCPANAALRPIHDRMPVVLPPEPWPVWLAGAEEVPLRAALALLRPCPAAWLRVRPVAPAPAHRPTTRPRRRTGGPAEQMRLLGSAGPTSAATGARRAPRPNGSGRWRGGHRGERRADPPVPPRWRGVGARRRGGRRR